MAERRPGALAALAALALAVAVAEAGAGPEVDAQLAEARAALRAAERARVVAEEDLRPEQKRAFAALAALDRIGRAPPLALLAHPGGPAEAYRAGLALAAAAPELQARAESIRVKLAVLAAATEAADDAAARLAAAARAARAPAVVAPALGGPVPTPRPLAAAGPADPAQTAAAVDRLLSALAAMDAPAEAQGRPARPPERWPAPAPGPVRAGPGPGFTIETLPYAGVRAPVTASVRYAGEAGGPGQGLTVVLEPQAGVLMALRGLAVLSVVSGQTVAAGALLGAMGGPPPAANEFLIDASAPRGLIPSQALYIEMRSDGATTDPAQWLRLTDERTIR